jgi:hypothetical protein
MGKPSVQARSAERWRVPARLRAHWLASSCRLGAGGASNYSLERRDYLCARTAWHRFRGFGETFAGNAGFRLTRFPAMTTKAGQESCSTRCVSDAVAGNSIVPVPLH